MFFKYSRYRRLPDVTSIDAQGRQQVSKSLRALPQVSGTFLHTIADVDRLDNLAFRYYGQPRKWWLICDANSEYMSPQALLGKEPLVTYRFALTPGDEPPPWSRLLAAVSAEVGIEDIQLADDETSVIVIFNRMNTSAEELATAIEGAGFAVAEYQLIGRVGKQIVIPPDSIG